MLRKRVVQVVLFRHMEPVRFKVDAGLIDRLGRELVGRAETAVSELIKNSYDADATKVEVYFKNTNDVGGSISIIDDGLGMNYSKLVNGFMTISSTDKLHNPKSERFKRGKAGKKGIGRFATQRLGTKLTIFTQSKNEDYGLKVYINWDDYKIDNDLTLIENKIEKIEKLNVNGTQILIENLRESWTTKEIERVFRYVSDLLQPDYLSDRSSSIGLATSKDASFKVSFYQIIGDKISIIADPQKMLFDKSLAVIEGFVDSGNEAFFGVSSESLELNDYAIPIFNKSLFPKYELIKNVHFKAYYFIYNRSEYYNNISKLELKNIQTISNESSGIRLYRNGFRVLPYGERTDDWLGLDIRYSGEEGSTNIPFANRNLFGFVEVIDSEGTLFEETASREGLIENKALLELKDFIFKALSAARGRVAEKITLLRKKRKQKIEEERSKFFNQPDEAFKVLEEFINNEQNKTETEAKQAFLSIRNDYKNLIEELGMLRVLAGLGLTIAEFTHEVIQYTPAINGFVESLQNEVKTENGIESLEKLKRVFRNFTSYTSYFHTTVSQNVSRELRPILIIDVVNLFLNTIQEDIKKQGFLVEHDIYDYDTYTTPMHFSEWGSILFNLYTNSKKAIRRANSSGKIKIISGVENKFVYLEFSDNGDGVNENDKDRIFNAFFTTSTPASLGALEEEKLTGTGLGLKIVKDIVETYGGSINLLPPEKEFSTCFRIDIPQATQAQINTYEL